MDSGISEISNVLDYIGDGKTLRDRFCAFAIKNLLPLAEKLTWVPKENEGTTLIVQWKGTFIYRF